MMKTVTSFIAGFIAGAYMSQHYDIHKMKSEARDYTINALKKYETRPRNNIQNDDSKDTNHPKKLWKYF